MGNVSIQEKGDSQSRGGKDANLDGNWTWTGRIACIDATVFEGYINAAVKLCA